MAKSLLYFTCPNEKCAKAGYVELENDDGKVVSHCTTHNAPKAMAFRAINPATEAHCYHCKTKVQFEFEQITVLKAVKYTPYSKLNSDARHFIETADLAGGKLHMDVIVENLGYAAFLNRELGRLDQTHYPRDWKLRIAGKWLRSLVTTWVKTSRNGNRDFHQTLDVEYTQLMTTYIR